MKPSDFDRTGAWSSSQGVPSAEERASEVLSELDAVIAELEDASQGSEALDGRVHFGFRVLADQSPDIAALLISEGISWPTVQAVLDEAIPPYTSSLDAAVDGENIMLVLRSAKRRRWGAMQRTFWGGEVMGWASTEPLARRLAALKTRRAEMAKAIEDERNAGESPKTSDIPQNLSPAAAEPAWVPTPDPTRERNNSSFAGSDGVEEKKPDEKAKDWEVLF